MTTIERDESGSALILALVMVTAIGLMLVGALSFADTSLVATPALVDHRDSYNSVDGAMEGAINAVRGSSTLGVENGPIPCGPFTPPPGADGVQVTVECTAQANSGTAADDQPPFAILTLGDKLSGAGFFEEGNSILRVDGGLYSNGVLDLTPNGNQTSMVSFGDVFVEGACKRNGGNLLDAVGGLVKCGYAGDSRGDDPNYPSGASSISGMSVDPTPTCHNASSVVVFSAGLYSEKPAAPSGCNGSVWWFQPGIYYFDFPDGRSVWQPTGKTVVGGTADGFNAQTLASSISVPGACDSTGNGVQFIFGGPSLLTITSQENIELCGSVSATNHNNHRIVFYGLKDEPARSAVGPTTLAETGTPVSPGPAVVVPFLLANPNAKTIDHNFASAALTTSGVKLDQASVTLPAFADVPDGSRIEKVELQVRHYEDSKDIDATASITLPSGTTDSEVLSNFKPSDCTTALTTCVDTWDITSHFRDEFAYDELNGLTASYSAKIKGSNVLPKSDFFDGMELKVTYVPPAFEAHRCPTGNSNCSIITSTVNQNLFFHGTVYVPNAGLDLWVHGQQKTIFDRGVIARTMTVDVSASSTQTESPFQLPQATTGREVLFVAKVDGVDKLRALVTYQDFVTTAGTTTAYPGYRVTVEKWSVIR